MALRAKQKRFVQEYLLDLNATAAYKRAGYAVKSDKAAQAASSRLLSNVMVQEELAADRKRLSERTEVKAEHVVQELARIAFSRLDRFVTWGAAGVKLLDSAQLSPDDAACVAEVVQTTSKEGGSLRFKLHNKVAALELLGKHLGMFGDQPPFPDGEETWIRVTDSERLALLRALLARLGLSLPGLPGPGPDAALDAPPG